MTAEELERYVDHRLRYERELRDAKDALERELRQARQELLERALVLAREATEKKQEARLWLFGTAISVLQLLLYVFTRKP